MAVALLAIGIGAIGVSGAGAASGARVETPEASTVIKKALSPNGSALTLNFTTPGKTAEVTFSGLNGEVIDVSTSAGTFASNCDVQLLLKDPQGTTIAGPVCAGQSGALPQTTLATDGTHKIVVAPSPTLTGSLKLSLTSTGAIHSITPNAKGIKVSVNGGTTASFGTIVPSGTRLSSLAINSTGFTGCPAYQITILKPDNTPLITQNACNTDTLFIDALPGVGAGTYTVQLTNFGGTKGTTTLSFYAFKDQAGTISPSGSGVAVTAKKGQPGQRALFSFAGSNGQKISAKVTGATNFAHCYTLWLVRPDGTTLTGVSACGSNDAFLDANKLDQNGTWQLVFDPGYWDTGSATVTAYLVTDQTFSITPNGSGVSQAVNVTTPGQRSLLSFTGSSGQKISAKVTGATNFPHCYSLWLVRPDGTTLTGVGACGSNDAFLETATLDQNGTWQLVFDPGYWDTGSATVTAYRFTDQTFSITPTGGGASQVVNVTTPGQRSLLSFAGSNGQQISAKVTGATNFPHCYILWVIRPDGATLTGVSACGSSDAFLDAVKLDQNGTWQLAFDPGYWDTGSATVTAYLVTDQTFTITPNGSGVSQAVNVTTPGQRSLLSFTGSSGQKISAKVTGATNFADCYSLWLIRPNGTTLTGVGACGSSDAFLDAATLDQNGTWQLVFDPGYWDTGSATVTAYLVTDQTGTIQQGGQQKSVSITTPGQNARFTFSGTSGTSVTVSVTGASFTTPGCYAVYLLRPDGSSLSGVASCGPTATLGPIALDATGTWTILVDPSGAETGTATLALT